MITQEQYLYAKQVFDELTAWLDGTKKEWFKQYGKEMPDDFIPYETFLTIDEMFGIMVRYQRQQKQRGQGK
ncbi:MAG: hypothetical protein LBF37_04040 [Rickettsiales bacterium]|jgi:hypothetical protein|nr:hypothetical protein [Rickettsiales bacterium]